MNLQGPFISWFLYTVSDLASLAPAYVTKQIRINHSSFFYSSYHWVAKTDGYKRQIIGFVSPLNSNFFQYQILSFHIDTVAPSQKSLREKFMYGFSSQMISLVLAGSCNVFSKVKKQLNLPLVKVLHLYHEVSEKYLSGNIFYF